MKNRGLLNEYYSNWKDSMILNEQQVSGGLGNYGNVWEFCGVTPGVNGGMGVPNNQVQYLNYGDVAPILYAAMGQYLNVPNYWVPEKCNDQECTTADTLPGQNEFVVTLYPNNPNSAQYHLRLVSVGQTTPTVTNVCNYGANPPAMQYNCPHYYNNFVSGSCLIDPLQYGCTDPTAINYVPTATMDDGSCIFPVAGCTDPLANNYDPLATVDDGSCTFTDNCHDKLNFIVCEQGTGVHPVGTSVWLGPTGDCYTCNGSMCASGDLQEPFLMNPSSNSIGTLVGFQDPSNSTQLVDVTTDVCPPPQGCTNPLATNYDPLAVIDDGSCIVPGCTDNTANNYNPSATIDDGSCTYDVLGCTDSTATNYDPLATVDDGSCFWEGCTDPTATNYDPNATVDDGSCIIPGCTDPAATNYNPNATVDDGSCVLPTVGCTDSTASNYNPIATVDDGSCYWLGCTDPTATNYDPNATQDDGSCIYPVYGCTDPLATNYDPLATVDDGSCIYPIPGCTDSNAFNYDPTATVDDGSCIYDGCTDNNASNFNPNATADCSGVPGGTDISCCVYTPGCMDPLATNYLPSAVADCSGTLGGTDTTCCVYPVPGCPSPNVTGTIVNTTTQFCVNGCEVYDITNPGAGCPNNNGVAIPGDTSCCCFLGCTDPNATNYDPSSCIDDGSCIIPAPINCSCCQVGQPGTISQPVGILINAWTAGGCASLNSTTLTNCTTSQAFDPDDCEPDCSNFDFASATNQSTSLGSDYTMIMTSYNDGLLNGQQYGIMDGNSPFCWEYCGVNNGNHWACDCCGDIYNCDQDWYWPKPFGCWTCDDQQGSTCSQQTQNWMSNNMSANYYDHQNDCVAAAPSDCPPTSSCSNNPQHCSENPSLTPGGSCWFCHHGVVCLPIYDYLEYGSGPPGSTGTHAFMMNWLYQTTNAAGTTIYQAGYGPGGQGPGDLYCNAQDCVANSPCTSWEVWSHVQPDCEPPAAGCPMGEIWYPYPKCECGLPKVVGPKDKDKEKYKEKEKEVEDKKTDSDDRKKEPLSEEYIRMRNIWNYKL